MLDSLVKVTRIAVVAFWFALFLSLISVIPNPYGRYIVWLGALVLLIHLVEYLFVRSKFAGRGRGGISFVQTMLFGFAYWLPLLKYPSLVRQAAKAERASVDSGRRIKHNEPR